MKERLIAINRDGVFSLEEARALFPVIKKITADYSQTVDQKIARLEALDVQQTELICDLETEAHELICEWHDKIRKLGGCPKGLWLVDFDAGDGYFCWKHPEPEILYWHGYTEGFSGRVPLENRPTPNLPEKNLVEFQSQQV